jgi:hypothetical protein
MKQRLKRNIPHSNWHITYKLWLKIKDHGIRNWCTGQPCYLQSLIIKQNIRKIYYIQINMSLTCYDYKTISTKISESDMPYSKEYVSYSLGLQWESVIWHSQADIHLQAWKMINVPGSSWYYLHSVMTKQKNDRILKSRRCVQTDMSLACYEYKTKDCQKVMYHV